MIVWLNQNGIKPDGKQLIRKLDDYKVSKDYYIECMNQRILSLSEKSEVYMDFKKEMIRFLPAKIVSETIDSLKFRTYLGTLIPELWEILKNRITNDKSGKHFLM